MEFSDEIGRDVRDVDAVGDVMNIQSQAKNLVDTSVLLKFALHGQM